MLFLEVSLTWHNSYLKCFSLPIFRSSTALLVTGNDESAKTDSDGIKIDESLKAGKGTNAGSLKTEEEAVKFDGLSVKELKDLNEGVSATKSTTNVCIFHSWNRDKTGKFPTIEHKIALKAT